MTDIEDSSQERQDTLKKLAEVAAEAKKELGGYGLEGLESFKYDASQESDIFWEDDFIEKVKKRQISPTEIGRYYKLAVLATISANLKKTKRNKRRTKKNASTIFVEVSPKA